MKKFVFIILLGFLSLGMVGFDKYHKSFAYHNPTTANVKSVHKKYTSSQSVKPHTYLVSCVDQKNVPYFSDGILSFYASDSKLFLNVKDSTRTAMSKELLKSIDNAKKSIDFAVYGVEGQTQITKALCDAQKRGVKVRWVVDSNTHGNNLYADTQKLMCKLTNYCTDLNSNSKARSNSSAIMHNKFFIIDNTTLILGSANLSDTDLGGFNSNVFVKIKSPKLCGIFEQEFEQMYEGFFHNAKRTIPDKKNITLPNNNVVSVYFSPKDKTISNAIVPLINQAQKYVYVPVFFLTDDETTEALISAQKRGVDVKVLMDAVAAANRYSRHKKLRAAGVSVKVENWAGKMHQKSLIIDDEKVVIGSMNLSKSGQLKNDESCIVVSNAHGLAKSYREYFMVLYDSVPNKWLNQDPRPESPDSIGSCQDGIDNDYDGRIDAQDSGCFTFYTKKKTKKRIYR